MSKSLSIGCARLFHPSPPHALPSLTPRLQIHIAGTVTTQLPFHVEDVEKPTYAPVSGPRLSMSTPWASAHLQCSLILQDTVVSDGLPADQQPKSGTATPDSSSGADHATEPSTSHNKHIGHQRSVGYTTRLDNRVIDLRVCWTPAPSA